MTEIYLLALVVALASGVAILTRRFSLPLVVCYLLAGAILSGFNIVRPESLAFLSFLPEIGLAFLLFLVGMELDLSEFRSLGKNVVVASLVQTGLTTAIFAALGVNPVLALAVSFSSTILVVKLLLESKELSSLHGRLAVGILLFEDLLAIGVLMFMSPAGGPAWIIIAKGLFLIWAALFSGKRLLPRVFRWTAESPELLFLTGIGWCLIFVSVSLLIGFSVGVGAFLAGISLAQSVYRSQISGRIKPLRDFFIMIFFIDLGAGLSIPSMLGYWQFALGLLVYTVVVKPIIFFLVFTRFRLRVHSAFQTAILLSCVSEFSLIILVLAGKTGVISKELLSPVIFVTVVSFVMSSLLTTNKQVIYAKLKIILKRLEQPGSLSIGFFPKENQQFTRHAILIGCDRSGSVILPLLRQMFGDNLLVVDFNPEVVEKLRNDFIPCLYGDAADPEIAELLNLKEADLVISTVRDLTDNLVLLDALEKSQSKAVAIVTASDTNEAIKLYERGASHVSIPLQLEGENINHLITAHRESLGELVKMREKKLGELKRAN